MYSRLLASICCLVLSAVTLLAPVRAQNGKLTGTVVDKANLEALPGATVVLEGTTASGRFAAEWDGRDQRGDLLPPGLYILRLRVDADKGEATRQAVLSLVY